jgi:hypothetical protein
MGFELKITGSNGQKFDSIGDMFEAEVKGLFDDTLSTVERAIQAQRCPVHHQAPSVSRRQKGDTVEFCFEACCEDLKARAEAAASRALHS